MKTSAHRDGAPREAAESLLSMSASTLRALTRFAHQRRLSPSEWMLIAIHVDSDWRPVVDKLMPGYDWASLRATGGVPIACGIVDRKSVSELVSAMIPKLKRRAKPVGRVLVTAVLQLPLHVFDVQTKLPSGAKGTRP